MNKLAEPAPEEGGAGVGSCKAAGADEAPCAHAGGAAAAQVCDHPQHAGAAARAEAGRAGRLARAPALLGAVLRQRLRVLPQGVLQSHGAECYLVKTLTSVIDSTGTPATRMAPLISVTDLAEECHLTCTADTSTPEITVYDCWAVRSLVQRSMRAS